MMEQSGRERAHRGRTRRVGDRPAPVCQLSGASKAAVAAVEKAGGKVVLAAGGKTGEAKPAAAPEAREGAESAS